MKTSPHFLIAAPSSNSGKTTLTLGLLRALKNRGMSVQPFKCGPDYIDPIHHTQAAGNSSVNLDTFMASHEHVTALYATCGQPADVCVTEGVMGLFDGADKMQGSSAAIAELLDIPVILVINAKSMAYSAAPLLYGFKNFYPGIRVVGAVFNFVNTESHYRFLQEACEDVGIEALGYLPKKEDIAIASLTTNRSLRIWQRLFRKRLISIGYWKLRNRIDLKVRNQYLLQYQENYESQ
jgi:cobyrinic acid a,c-diamide synthase